MRLRTSHLPLLAVVLIALLILTAVSYAVAFVELGAFGPPVALGIASLKVGLVVWYFMELRQTSVSARTAFGVMVAFIIIMCLGIASDVGLR